MVPNLKLNKKMNALTTNRNFLYALRFPLLLALLVVNSASKPLKVLEQDKKVFKLVYLRSEISHKFSEDSLNFDELPSIQHLFDVANHYLGKHAVFFIAIKIEESGADKKPSWLAKNYNNLVGMRFPRTRETYAIASTNSNYAIYRNWFECMLDFKIYMENIERSFIKKNNREFADEYEMLDYLFKYFNGFDKWYNDMRFLIKYVKRKYANDIPEVENTDILIFE